jgi:hypothetical protein
LLARYLDDLCSPVANIRNQNAVLGEMLIQMTAWKLLPNQLICPFIGYSFQSISTALYSLDRNYSSSKKNNLLDKFVSRIEKKIEPELHGLTVNMIPRWAGRSTKPPEQDEDD